MGSIVMVLGWWRSKPVHRQKYVQLYEKHGSVRCVLQHTMNTVELVVEPLRAARASKVVKDIKEKSTGGDCKVFFHCMSNNGALLFLSVARLLPSNVTVGGVVFDSCPGDLNAKVGVGAISAAGKKHKTAVLTSAVLTSLGVAGLALYAPPSTRRLFAFVKTVVMALFVQALAEKAITYRYHRRFVTHPLVCPELYLYGPGDVLVNHETVENIIERRRMRGILVQAKSFQESDHVAHFLRYPEEYESTVFQFMDHCLSHDTR